MGIDFASIAFEIHLKISEKMNYLDKKEFELSSRYGRDIANCRQRKPTIDLDLIELSNGVILWVHKKRKFQIKIINWKNIRENYVLPRFKVPLLRIRVLIVEFINYLNEINEKAGFTSDKVKLRWQGASLPVHLFVKLADIFNISSFTMEDPRMYLHYPRCLAPEMFRQEQFQKIDTIDLVTAHIPDQTLEQMNASTLIVNFPPSRAGSVQVSSVNLFLKQWFQKSRCIIRLELPVRKTTDRLEEKLYDGLPCSVVKRWNKGEKKEEFWLNNSTTERNNQPEGKYRLWSLAEGHALCSIDREDRKLLVFISSEWILVAAEYTDLNELL